MLKSSKEPEKSDSTMRNPGDVSHRLKARSDTGIEERVEFGNTPVRGQICSITTG